MWKKFWACLLILAVAFPLSTVNPVFTGGTGAIEIDLATLNESDSGSGYSYVSGLLTITGEGPFTITTSSAVSGRGILVDTAGTTALITLQDVSISNTGANACALALTDGSSAAVTVVGSNTLTSGQDRAGLNVPAGAEVTISGSLADSLTVTGGRWSAGLGGNNGESGGTMTITGTEVTATGHEYAAGIGSGRMGSSVSSGGTITITAARVTAAGGANGGAGIGGGYLAAGGTITITDSVITATGGTYGAGVGGGRSNSSGIITILNSQVTATGGNGGGAGIGSGNNAHAYSITIGGSSTVVHAQGGTYGAGIGGGDGGNGSSMDGRITISGGDITAVGGTWAAGIGGGRAANGGIIVLSDCVINATGSQGGAGIGGGRYNGSGGMGGSVTITNATVTAAGTDGAKDVGAGFNSSNNGLLRVGINQANDADPFATRARLTLSEGGADQAVATMGTCTIDGAGAGPLAGTYLNGTMVTAINLATVGGGGDGYTFAGGLLTLTDEGPYLITSSVLTANRVLVNPSVGVTAKIIAHDLTISATETNNSAFALAASAKAELTLLGENTLVSGNNRAGLEVPEGAELVIDGTTADALTVTGGYYAAGIGGGYSVTPANAGAITVKGGTITSAGGDAAGGTGAGAGIGGGRGGSGGTITIEGGTLTATGGYRAAGIGGGQSGTGGTIVINGGDITATGHGYSAGIGGGYLRPAENITITGGKVTATGVGGGAGIGGGSIDTDLSATHTGGTILITGGEITANALAHGSGIGSGLLLNVNYVLPTTVTISGGVINAGSHGGAGIGSRAGTINISGGTVTAISHNNGAGIGGGYRESGGTINISGGTIIASGAAVNGGAGIGGGFPNEAYDILNGGNITISGGQITATGGEYGAGIGGGHDSGAGTINISAGDITANGVHGGAGIGGGFTGNSGTITITGGTITAAGTEMAAGIGKGHWGGDGAIVISQAEVTASSQFGSDAISAGNSGTVYIGFTGTPLSPVYDPFVTRADVTLVSGGLPSPATTFGTCLISGDGAGELAGSYIEGVRQTASPFGGGDGSSPAEAYEISSPEQLAQLAVDVNAGQLYEDKHFKLTGDLDLSGIAEWLPIGSATNPFKGHFDGGRHIISNLTIGSTAVYSTISTQAGLFGCIGPDASVSNTFVDSLAFYIAAADRTGGLVGFNDGGTINYCGVRGSIHSTTATASIGGLVGQNKGDVTNSYASVNISASYSSTGGLVGDNYHGNIANCYATGNVSGGAYPHAGGLVGYAFGSGSVRNCYATGNVSGSGWGYVGGIYGRNNEGSTNFTNNYWNEDAEILATELHGSTPFVHGSSEGCLALPAAQLKSAEMVTLLNSGRPNTENFYGWEIIHDVNNGFPVLQQTLGGDSEAPVVTDGALTAGSITHNSLVLNWQKATDNITADGALLYRVYQSATDNIRTLGEIESNGTPVGISAADINTKAISGLAASTLYYFNVIVMDEAGNKTAYTSTSAETVAAPAAGFSGGGSQEPAAIHVVTESGQTSTVNKTTVPATTVSRTTSANISSAVVTALLTKADQTNGTAKSDVIEVVIQAGSGINRLTVTLQQTDLNKITSQTDASFAVTSPFISVSFDGKALDAINKADSGGTVVFTAGAVDSSTLTATDRAKVQGRPIYSFSVLNGSRQVSHFGGGKATITIPYTLFPGENANAVVIYHLDESGRLKTVRGCYDAATGTVVFKTAHFSKFVIAHNPVTFSDIAADAWYRNAAEFIAARGITSGTGNNNYNPQARLTRGQYVVLLMNAYQLGLNTDNYSHIHNFSDAGNTYYTEYLLAARALGLVNGIGNNLFAPEKEVTRQEMFVLLYNALALLDELPVATGDSRLDSFSDAGLVATWARDAVSSLVSAGIVGGSGNHLYPTTPATRAEMAQILYRLLSE